MQPNTIKACSHYSVTAMAYQEVAQRVDDYFHALTTQPTTLAKILHPVWSRRYLENQQLQMQSRAEFLQQIGDTAPTKPLLTSIQLYVHDFAIARIDDWESNTVSLLTLFKNQGRWWVVGESVSNSQPEQRQARYNASTATDQILEALDGYYTAVDEDNPALLDQVFHPDWQMKNHENREICAESKAVFAERLYDDVNKGYALDRQVADIQLIYDHMAYVRIDKPSSPVTTVFILFRINGQWLIADKAWSVEK